MSINRKTCLAKVKSLIKAECCNYDPDYCGIYSYCFDPMYALDRRCSYFEEDSDSCEWFEEAVLPLNPVLAAAYEINFCIPQYKPGMYEENTKILRCKMCPAAFVAANNRSVLCPTCNEKQQKEKSRSRSRAYREKKRLERHVLEG